MSTTFPQKNGGFQGDSILDKMLPEMIEFGEMVQNENWMESFDVTSNSDELLDTAENMSQFIAEYDVTGSAVVNEVESVVNVSENQYPYPEYRERDILLRHLRSKKSKKLGTIKSVQFVPSKTSVLYAEWIEKKKRDREKCQNVIFESVFITHV